MQIPGTTRLKFWLKRSNCTGIGYPVSQNGQAVF